jgi:hypothetical protein
MSNVYSKTFDNLKLPFLIILWGANTKWLPDAFRQAFRDKINLDKLKTTADGAVRTLGPNPLDEGGSRH